MQDSTLSGKTGEDLRSDASGLNKSAVNRMTHLAEQHHSRRRLDLLLG